MSDAGRRSPAAALLALLAAISALVVISSSVAGAVGAAQGQDPGLPVPVPEPVKGRVVLVGDSIMLGAEHDLEAAFSTAGYNVVVDAAESRSTLAGADVLGSNLAWGADAVVLMLGANDAGNSDAFRTRVRAVLDRAPLVPHVYWLTIPEVRSYYPAANQVLREELATRPGAEVLEWHSVSGGAGMTASDGLHLTAPGAEAMAWYVAVNTIADLEPPPTTTVPAAAASADPTIAVPATGGDSGAKTASETAVDEPPAGPVDSGARRVEQAAEVAAESSVWRPATPVALAAVGVLALLGLAGAGLAAWSLRRTR